MKFTASLTDSALLTELGARIARARLQADRTQEELAREAGLSRATLRRLEGGASTQLTNLVRVLRALGLIGGLEALLPEPVESPLESYRRKEKPRQRASGRRGAREEAEDGGQGPGWSWGDES